MVIGNVYEISSADERLGGIPRADCARGQKNLYDFGFSLRLAGIDGSTEQSTFGRTDNGFVALTICTIRSCRQRCWSGGSEYESRRAIRQAILKNITSTGRLSIDTQTDICGAEVWRV